MPLGTLDRSPPPFFRQGPSALSKLMVFSALAIFLMVADARFKITRPLRILVATALAPVQWVLMRPVTWLQTGGQYLETMAGTQSAAMAASARLAQLALRATQVEQLLQENERLRKLLVLRDRLSVQAQAAQVLYDMADPYTRKVVVDKGLLDGVSDGSPVLDEAGVLGQVTRAYPSISEVTLLTDREQSIPVLNTRTGARSLAFGDPAAHANGLEVRFMAASDDVQVGDLLTTSGVDGVYPPGLPVAQIDSVERRVDTAFARIHARPKALDRASAHVLVLRPVTAQIPARPAPESALAKDKRTGGPATAASR